MKKLMLSAVLAGSLFGMNVLSADDTQYGAALSELVKALPLIPTLQTAYNSAATDINAAATDLKAAKDDATKGRSAIKIINSGITPITKLVALFSILAASMVALNKASISNPVKANIQPNLVKAQSTLQQVTDTLALLGALIPEEKPTTAEDVQLQEDIFG